MAVTGKRPRIMKGLLAITLFVILILLLLPNGGGKEELVSFHFINVGQGDAILIMTPEGHILIDTGPNGAEDTLAAYLKVKGVTSLACMILTHPHEDHAGGADMIFSRFTTERVVLTGASDASLDERTHGMMEASGADIIHPKGLWTLTLGQVTVEVFNLSPGSALINGTTEPEEAGNNDSLIVKVTYGDVSALFMGDAENEEETALLEAMGERGWLDCDLLKLGHHGSDSSTSEELLDAVTPKVAVIMTGAGNAYGHPNAAVLSRLANRAIPCLRTDTEGHIVLFCDKKSLYSADGRVWSNSHMAQ